MKMKKRGLPCWIRNRKAINTQKFLVVESFRFPVCLPFYHRFLSHFCLALDFIVSNIALHRRFFPSLSLSLSLSLSRFLSFSSIFSDFPCFDPIFSGVLPSFSSQVSYYISNLFRSAPFLCSLVHTTNEPQEVEVTSLITSTQVRPLLFRFLFSSFRRIFIILLLIKACQRLCRKEPFRVFSFCSVCISVCGRHFRFPMIFDVFLLRFCRFLIIFYSLVIF